MFVVPLSSGIPDRVAVSEQWRVRELVASALTKFLGELPDPIMPWTVCVLERFRSFLEKSLDRNETIAVPEQDLFKDILFKLNDLNTELQFGHLRAHALSALNSDAIDLDEPGSAEAVSEFLERPHRLRGLNLLDDEHTETELDRLTKLLKFLSFLPRRLPEGRQSAVIVALTLRVETLWRIYHDEGGPGGGEHLRMKRQIVARLLWAENELAYRQPTKTTDFDAWWSILRNFELLGRLPDAAEVDTLEDEANSLSNVIRFVRELDVLQRQRANGTAANMSSEHTRVRDTIEELRNYIRELLLTRMPQLAHKLNDKLNLLQDVEDKERRVVLLTLHLRVLLQFYNFSLAPGVRKLREIASEVEKTVSAGISVGSDGAHYPDSESWQRYGDQSVSLRHRLANYVKAFQHARTKSRVKPFVILVLGQPGTGKSQFIDSVVAASIKPSPGDDETLTVATNLSQATSVPEYLEAIWRTLAAKEDRLKIVIFDEFDTHVDMQTGQYRYVLAPLWDGRMQVIETAGHRSIRDVVIGPFVAVCVMSKAETLSDARRLLLQVDKGVDFLSRVDAVVEIPSFDCTKTQLSLALVALWRQFKNGAGVAAIGEVCLWCLAWLVTSDNFRTIAKAVKTLSEGEPTTYADLNLHTNIRREFEMLVAELGRLDGHAVSDALAAASEGTALALSVEVNDSRLHVKRASGSLAALLGL